MTTRRRIRQQVSTDVGLGEQFRDAQQGQDVVPLTLLRRVTMNYTEPLAIGAMKQAPEGIEAMRVIDLSSQEAVLLAGSFCNFVWRPNKGGAVVTSIDGMSIAANGGRRYRFTFRLTYAPMGGFNG